MHFQAAFSGWNKIMVSCGFSSVRDIVDVCRDVSSPNWNVCADSKSWWPSLIFLLHRQKNSISVFLECMMHNDIMHQEDLFDIFAIQLAVNGSERTPSNHWMGLSWTSVQGQWSWTMGCLAWGQDSLKRISTLAVQHCTGSLIYWTSSLSAA